MRVLSSERWSQSWHDLAHRREVPVRRAARGRLRLFSGEHLLGTLPAGGSWCMRAASTPTNNSTPAAKPRMHRRLGVSWPAASSGSARPEATFQMTARSGHTVGGIIERAPGLRDTTGAPLRRGRGDRWRHAARTTLPRRASAVARRSPRLGSTVRVAPALSRSCPPHYMHEAARRVSPAGGAWRGPVAEVIVRALAEPRRAFRRGQAPQTFRAVREMTPPLRLSVEPAPEPDDQPWWRS